MVPVAFLQLDSTRAQWVLDLCAAPGSKTSQLLDCVGPDGVVVANDRDPHRAYMLVRRCLALGHAAAKLLVTNHSAQKFPRFPTNLSAGVGAGFDRVLADVPCSGDGTTRKYPSIWKRWLPGYGIKLHTVQLQIALRGAWGGCCCILLVHLTRLKMKLLSLSCCAAPRAR